MADALRKKNRERMARDGAIKKKVTMDLQREAEKALKVLLEKFDGVFKASGVQFGADASSSDEEGGQAPAPRPPAAADRRESPHRGDAGALPAPSASKTSEIEVPAPGSAVIAETSDSSTTTSESQ